MAAAFAKQIADGAVAVGSAGSTPAERLNPAVVLAMEEVGFALEGPPRTWKLRMSS
jgi:arsenate reductase